MLYIIKFDYTDPATGQIYNFKGIKEGRTAGEAIYYFKRQYPRHDIIITEVNPV